jgi:MATE family multidrug resistance protein
MLSILSTNVMLFLDRLILSRYALEAMNGAAVAMMPYFVILVGIIGIVAIAEVFVGRFNGAGEFQKIGNAVWQMIWFSLLTTTLFWAAGFFAAETLAGGHDLTEWSVPYFQWLCTFGAAAPMVVAVSSFFIGTGKTKLVLASTVIGNLMNVGLDYALIFGVGEWIPSMGTAGAALATGLSQVVQLVILGAVFFNRGHREKYGTTNYHWNAPLFRESLRVGLPSSAGHMIEVTAWALILRMMAMTGEAHITVMAIGQGIYSLIAFVMEGLNKSVTAIASNLIGAEKPEIIKKLRRSAITSLLILAGVVAIPLLLYPDWLVGLFLQAETVEAKKGLILSMSIAAASWIWLYFIADGITWINAGVLTAAKDTAFIAIVNGLSAWFVALIPIYLIVVKGGAGPTVGWAITVLYGTVNAIAFTYRANKVGEAAP